MKFSGITGRLPARTLITVLVGIFFAAAFVIVFWLPNYQAASLLRREIVALRAEVAFQQQLVPLQVKLRQAEASLPSDLPTVKVEPLPLSELGRLAERIGDLAKPAGLQVAAVSPEASSAGKQGLLSVRMRLLGPMDGVRSFLVALGGFGPLVEIQSASTKVGQDGRELTLTCWLAVR